MTIQQVFKKAKEGGYKMQWDKGLESAYPFRALLDPLFWESYGKSLKWNMTNKFQPGDRNTEWNYVSDSICQQMLVCDKSPAFYWHKFIDHLALGKTIESYFENIN